VQVAVHVAVCAAFDVFLHRVAARSPSAHESNALLTNRVHSVLHRKLQCVLQCSVCDAVDVFLCRVAARS